MASERGDVFEISEKMLVGDALARRPSRKRGDTGSRRKSGSAVFTFVSGALCARCATSSLALAVDVVDDLGWGATAGRVVREFAVGAALVEALQGISRVFDIDGHSSEVAAAILWGNVVSAGVSGNAGFNRFKQTYRQPTCVEGHVVLPSTHAKCRVRDADAEGDARTEDR
jgi:hypothetical protein